MPPLGPAGLKLSKLTRLVCACSRKERVLRTETKRLGPRSDDGGGRNQGVLPAMLVRIMRLSLVLMRCSSVAM